MTLKHMAARATFATLAGLSTLFVSSAIAAAEPPPPAPAPGPQAGTENNAAPEEQQREQKKADCGDWCEVVNAAKQLPAPNWGAVDVPKLVDASVPINFGIGLPDVVPDITLAPPALSLPPMKAPAVAAPKLKLGPPPMPKLPKPNVPFIPGI